MSAGGVRAGGVSDGSFVALQLNDSYKPITDGVAVGCENYARILNRNGTACAIAAPHSPGWEDADEFPVFRYPSLPIPGWKPYRAGVPSVRLSWGRRLDEWLDRDGAVVLHVHSPFASAKLGEQLRRRLRARGREVVLISTLHSKYHDDLARTFRAPVVDAIIARICRSFSLADAVWVPNKGTEQTLRGYGYEGAVTIVPNGCDYDLPTDTEYMQLREAGTHALAVSPDVTVLLYVGQLRWEKNIEVILRAYALGKPASKRKLVLVGEGPDRRGIADLARSLGLGDRLTMFGHVTERSVLATLYARADIFVFPSVYDNAPLVVREAAAFRTPAILARGSAAAGNTVDGRSAFHSEPDATAIARLIERLDADPHKRQEVGETAQREVFRTWRDVVAEVQNRYRALVVKARDPASGE